VPNKNIFCNTPWYELHIYWDGSLGICCQEDHKLYSGNGYNIATTSITEWFNSVPVKNFRQRMLGNTQLSECRRCYHEEQQSGTSRRNRSNQKSVIFTQAFEHSFEQSPGRRHFDLSGTTDNRPIDLHIDLGNYCNLACKMCDASASSVIAVQEVKWGIESSRPYIGADWTKDTAVWENFKQQLVDIPELNNIHLMGGETLLTDKFEDLVDHMIAHGRTDVCFSFVTNGTVYKPSLMQKLLKFRRVGIEVSIECLTERNVYQRQGTSQALVLANLEKYKTLDNGNNITVTLRPAVSLLTIGDYASLLDYALDQQFIVKSLLVTKPRFLDVSILPDTIKQQYIARFDHLKNITKIVSDYNESDVNQLTQIIVQQANMCVNLLSTAAPVDSEQQLKLMVEHCRKWDKVYHLDARKLYPELTDIWDRYDY